MASSLASFFDDGTPRLWDAVLAKARPVLRQSNGDLSRHVDPVPAGEFKSDAPSLTAPSDDRRTVEKNLGGSDLAGQLVDEQVAHDSIVANFDEEDSVLEAARERASRAVGTALDADTMTSIDERELFRRKVAKAEEDFRKQMKLHSTLNVALNDVSNLVGDIAQAKRLGRFTSGHEAVAALKQQASGSNQVGAIFATGGAPASAATVTTPATPPGQAPHVISTLSAMNPSVSQQKQPPLVPSHLAAKSSAVAAVQTIPQVKESQPYVRRYKVRKEQQPPPDGGASPSAVAPPALGAERTSFVRSSVSWSPAARSANFHRREVSIADSVGTAMVRQSADRSSAHYSVDGFIDDDATVVQDESISRARGNRGVATSGAAGWGSVPSSPGARSIRIVKGDKFAVPDDLVAVPESPSRSRSRSSSFSSSIRSDTPGRRGGNGGRATDALEELHRVIALAREALRRTAVGSFTDRDEDVEDFRDNDSDLNRRRAAAAQKMVPEDEELLHMSKKLQGARLAVLKLEALRQRKMKNRRLRAMKRRYERLRKAGLLIREGKSLRDVIEEEIPEDAAFLGIDAKGRRGGDDSGVEEDIAESIEDGMGSAGDSRRGVDDVVDDVEGFDDDDGGGWNDVDEDIPEDDDDFAGARMDDEDDDDVGLDDDDGRLDDIEDDLLRGPLAEWGVGARDGEATGVFGRRRIDFGPGGAAPLRPSLLSQRGAGGGDADSPRDEASPSAVGLGSPSGGRDASGMTRRVINKTTMSAATAQQSPLGQEQGVGVSGRAIGGGGGGYRSASSVSSSVDSASFTSSSSATRSDRGRARGSRPTGEGDAQQPSSAANAPSTAAPAPRRSPVTTDSIAESVRTGYASSSRRSAAGDGRSKARSASSSASRRHSLSSAASSRLAGQSASDVADDVDSSAQSGRSSASTVERGSRNSGAAARSPTSSDRSTSSGPLSDAELIRRRIEVHRALVRREQEAVQRRRREISRRKAFIASWRVPTLSQMLDPYATPPSDLPSDSSFALPRKASDGLLSPSRVANIFASTLRGFQWGTSTATAIGAPVPPVASSNSRREEEEQGEMAAAAMPGQGVASDALNKDKSSGGAGPVVLLLPQREEERKALDDLELAGADEEESGTTSAASLAAAARPQPATMNIESDAMVGEARGPHPAENDEMPPQPQGEQSPSQPQQQGEEDRASALEHDAALRLAEHEASSVLMVQDEWRRRQVALVASLRPTGVLPITQGDEDPALLAFSKEADAHWGRLDAMLLHRFGAVAHRRKSRTEVEEEEEDEESSASTSSKSDESSDKD